MNNNGNFHGGTPAALMSYPFPMYDQPQQHPPLMEHPPMHPQAPFFAGPRLNAHSPRFYPPAAGVDTINRLSFHSNALHLGPTAQGRETQTG